MKAALGFATCSGRGGTFSLAPASGLKILRVQSKAGEAVSLGDRQRRVFDPGYLASSTLSQPLEPSQGN